MNTFRQRATSRSIDTDWPQTVVMPPRSERKRNRVIKDRRPLIDWRDPLESSAIAMLVIGLCCWAICAWWPQ